MVFVEGVVVQRYHEFVYDVRLEGGYVIVAHLANSYRGVSYEDVNVGDIVTVEVKVREHGPFHRIHAHRTPTEEEALRWGPITANPFAKWRLQ